MNIPISILQCLLVGCFHQYCGCCQSIDMEISYSMLNRQASKQRMRTSQNPLLSWSTAFDSLFVPVFVNDRVMDGKAGWSVLGSERSSEYNI